MNYRNRGGNRGTKRTQRQTKYGNPIDKEAAMTTKAITTKNLPATTTKVEVKKAETTKSYTSTSYGSKFAPISDEVTPYGAKKYRTPWTKDEYTGFQGSPIPAYIFDIDGTLQGWGSGGSKKAMDWAKKLYDAKGNEEAVFIVITARDHGSFGYTTSFNWLMHNFPYPFIGPFARGKDDPRYASEFKRELAQGFEDMGLYQIMGAADDNDWVIKMWKQWAIDHFEDPKDFDLLECDYEGYASWRSDLPSKGGYHGSYGSTGGHAYDSHKGEHWDKTLGKWEKDERTVGGIAQVWEKGFWDDAAHKYQDGKWVVAKAVQGSFQDDPAWKTYFAARDAAGAYSGVDTSAADQVADALDEVVGEIGAGDYTAMRQDLEDIVGHADPNLTPGQIAMMTITELREEAGVIGDATEDYRDALLVEIYRQFGEERYTRGELNACGLDDLEYLLDQNTTDADAFIDSLDVPIEAEIVDDEAQADLSEAHIASKDPRITLEDDVYASYEDLTWREIEDMDIVVLQRLFDTAANAPAHEKLYFHGQGGVGAEDAGEPTGPLDVAEILSNLDGDVDPQAFDMPNGRTYELRGSELVDITEQIQGELQQQSPRYGRVYEGYHQAM